MPRAPARPCATGWWPSPCPRARARPTIPRAIAPRPTPTTAAAARAMRARSARHPTARTPSSSGSHLGHAFRFEVCDVVDAADDHAAVPLLDQRDGRVLDLERKQATTGATDDAMQRHLDHAAVCDDQHVGV